MRKIEKTSELLWIFGIVFVALGVAICSKADLGVSMVAAPAFVIYEFIALLWSGFSVGMTEYMIQGLMLILLCLVIRKFHWRYLLAFAVAVIYGYVLNFFLFLMQGFSLDATWLRWVMLLLGDVITGFGVACFFRTYMPLQVYELFVAELASSFSWDIGKTKMVFDYTLLGISVLLAVSLFGDVTTFDFTAITHTSYHSLGLGTIATTLINSPLITLMGKLLDKIFVPTPRFPRIKKSLHGE